MTGAEQIQAHPMTALIILGSVFLYIVIGTVVAGLATRIMKGDSLLPVFLLFWPLSGIGGCLALLYHRIAYRKWP